MAQTSQATPVSETLYKFKSNTAWGKLNVLARDLHGRFKLEVETGSQALGWTLKDETSGRTISKGGLNPTSRFEFTVDQAFLSSYRLTVFLSQDREEIPINIRISVQKEDSTDTTDSETADTYQENLDHPYNTMVKSLYEMAVSDYAKGDNLHALGHLRKAQELDPTQPQVQALLDKIQSSKTKITVDPLEKIKDHLSKGEKEDAQAELEDYLNLHPQDPQALALKEQIAGKDRPTETLQNALSKGQNFERENQYSKSLKWYKKALKLDPQNKEAQKSIERLEALVNKPIKEKKNPKLSDTDAQAQSDQAYNLGLDSYRRGDNASAKKFWEETLQILPTHLQAQRNLERLKNDHPELK